MNFQRLRLRAIAAIALGSTTLVTCSSGGGSSALSKQDPLASVNQAMQAAKSGRIDGTIQTPKQADGPLTGEWSGGLRGGEQQTHAALTASNGTRLPTELRVVGNIMYYSRTVASLSNEPTLSLFTRNTRFKVWRQARLQGIITVVPAGFSPGALVQWLQQLHTPVRVRPGARVGSAKTSQITTTRAVAVGIWTGATVDMWVDGKARIVRVQISSPRGGARYDVTDYGTPVEVQPPPAAQVSTVSEAPVLEPAGAFTTVQSGTTLGVAWALQRSPGTYGTVCWRWQASPPLPQAGLKRPALPRCIKPPAKGADPEDTVTFVVDGNGSGPYDALALSLPPGAKNVTLGFVGGKMQNLAAAPVVVWVGPNDPVKGYVGVTLADGTKLDCGAGAIATPADLTDPAVTSIVAAAPWGCLQHTAS
jgi:hypothetical protein